MYPAHFGLKRPLFESGIAQDAAVFLAPKHELLIANCKVALTTFDSAVVLTGNPGVGKTTLISCALRATSTRLALGWITGTPAHGGELLELLLVEFGFNAHRAGRVERMQMWRQFLNEMSTTESRVFVIAERADDLSHDVLRALDSLTAADPNGCPGANLVLLGQPALLDHINTPALESLRQRIRLRERLEPFTVDELRGYLAHRATRAGGDLDKVFAHDAVGTLHELSGGIPRIANNLCETALNLAAAGNESVLTSELLTRIAVAMFGIDPRAAAMPAAEFAATPIAPAAATAAAEPPRAVPVVREAAPITAATPAAIPARDAAPQVPIAAPTFASLGSVAFAQSTPTYSLPPASGKLATVSAAREEAPSPDARAPVLLAPRPPPPLPLSPRPESPPIVTRSSGAAPSKPAQERSTRPLPPAAPPSFPPVIASRASAPAPRTEPEIDSFADTLTDMPDVQMPDLPVLTDAVEPSVRAERPRARTETAYARHDAAPPARAPIVTPSPSTPAPPSARSAPPAPSPSPSAQPKPATPVFTRPAAAPSLAAASPEDDLTRQTQTVRALAAAKSIDDISNSMAETLFGEADLDMLNTAFASTDWPEAGKPPEPAAKNPEPAKAAAPRPKPSVEEDPFDLFDLGPDAPLELIDDSAPSEEDRHKAASNR